jgi:hypothetical protein
MLGQKLFFIDMKTREIKEGFVLSRIISQSGYIVNIIVDNEGKHNVENRLVFENKEDAEKRLPEVLAIKDSMDAKVEEEKKVLDTMREQVIGKPEFKELADEFFSK